MIKGKLEFYFETGMEGAEWTVFDFENHTKDPNPYNSLHFLENGDKLRIYEKGNKIWEVGTQTNKKTKGNNEHKRGL
ncbi:MAG: hypothetical protein WCK90_03550 [archaeon]